MISQKKEKKRKRIKLILIGESPSKTRPKGKEKLNFSGKTSYILWNELKEYGITREDCIVENIVDEPVDKNNLSKTALDKKNIKRLSNIIKENDYDVIILFGNFAKDVFMNNVYKGEDVFCSVHPAAVARNKKLLNTFKLCLYEAIKYATRKSGINISWEYHNRQ